MPTTSLIFFWRHRLWQRLPQLKNPREFISYIYRSSGFFLYIASIAVGTARNCVFFAMTIFKFHRFVVVYYVVFVYRFSAEQLREMDAEDFIKHIQELNVCHLLSHSLRKFTANRYEKHVSLYGNSLFSILSIFWIFPRNILAISYSHLFSFFAVILNAISFYSRE